MRILLVRLDGIGDAAVCVPLVAGLRAAGHEVGAALTTRNAGLFAPGTLLAEHVLERIPWPAHGSTPQSTARARAEIARAGYDVALIATEEPEGYVLAAGIPERVGFTTGLARPLKSVWVRLRATRAVRRSQRIGGEEAHEVEVLYRLGAGFVPDGPPPADAARLRTLLVGPARPPVRHGVLLQAGPKWAASGVSASALRRVADALRPRGLRVVAGPGEERAVEAALDERPETFARVRDWVEALDEALLVVTVDTGAAHVAGMLGVAVADVFPDRHFAAQVRRWRPWAAPYAALRASAIEAGGDGPIAEAFFREL